MAHKRTIEVFTAGCPCCDEAVQLVRSIACPSCDVRILDMRTDTAAQVKAKQYSIVRVPRRCGREGRGLLSGRRC